MKAHRALADCRIALGIAEGAQDADSWRIAWIGLLATLQTVGVVLWVIDRMSSPALHAAVMQRFEVWRRDSARIPIFWHFVKAQVEIAASEHRTASAGPPFEMNGDLVFWHDRYCLDVAREAIEWWGAELDVIDAVSKGEAVRMSTKAYRDRARLSPALIEKPPR